jgi:flagellar basal-body rod protein FlgF
MDPLTAAAAAGLQANMDAFDLLANNLANGSTIGFKADREFHSSYLAADAEDPFNGSVGESPVIQKQWTDFAQGTLLTTGNPTDLALSGTGFFAVNGPNGTLYTRSGTFRFSAQGTLISADGYTVRMRGGGTLQTQSPDPIEVTPEGQIMQDGAPLGQLELANFSDPSQLSRQAGTYFENPDPLANPLQAAVAQVYQGKTESSNTGTADAAARMVSLMRHFEMLQHAIKIGADMSRSAVEEVARIGS